MIHAGQAAQFERQVTQDDFDRFARLCGDDNPIHVDPAFAARTRFGKTVAHGMFLYSLVCNALNGLIPGAVQLQQDLMFPNPTPVGERVRVTLTVLSVEPNGTARFEATVTRSDGAVGLEGQMLVKLPDKFTTESVKDAE